MTLTQKENKRLFDTVTCHNLFDVLQYFSPCGIHRNEYTSISEAIGQAREVSNLHCIASQIWTMEAAGSMRLLTNGVIELRKQATRGMAI